MKADPGDHFNKRSMCPLLPPPPLRHSSQPPRLAWQPCAAAPATPFLLHHNNPRTDGVLLGRSDRHSASANRVAWNQLTSLDSARCCYHFPREEASEGRVISSKPLNRLQVLFGGGDTSADSIAGDTSLKCALLLGCASGWNKSCAIASNSD